MVTKNVIGSNIPIEISKGGTGTSSTTTSGITRFNGTNLNISQYAKIDANNYYINSKQPAFYGNSDTVLNATGTANFVTLINALDTGDRANNYSLITGVFIAPVDGLYRLSSQVVCTNASVGTNIELRIVTNGYNYVIGWNNSAGSWNKCCSLSVLAYMAAGDTAEANIAGSGEASNILTIDPSSKFLGTLVC